MFVSVEDTVNITLYIDVTAKSVHNETFIVTFNSLKKARAATRNNTNEKIDKNLTKISLFINE